MRTDEALLASIRSDSESVYHPAGSCRMGDDELAVVDCELRVRGTDGLRVAGASIMPTVVSGDTHAACVAIGQKCADLVASI